jgi:Ca2+-binding RTX toxin-like protein
MGTITGTGGDDTLSGTIGADLIYGLGGSDTLSGAAGNDIIHGGEGNDRLDGDLGDDVLYGGFGDDFLTDTSGGNDALYGNAGRDSIYVYSSDLPDTIDWIDGGSGDDSISYSASYLQQIVHIRGGEGNDAVYIYGGNGFVDVGDGSDTLTMHRTGSYTLTLGGAPDVIKMGETFELGNGFIVTDFLAGDAGDRLSLADYLSYNLQNWNQNNNPFASGHLKLTQSGSDTLLQVDRDGSAPNHYLKTLLTFQNTTASNLTAVNLGGYPSDGTIPSFLDGTNGYDVQGNLAHQQGALDGGTTWFI